MIDSPGGSSGTAQPVGPAPIANGLSGIVRFLAGASGVQRAAIAFAAGAVSNLAMAPFFLSPVLLVTFPLLVWLIDTSDRSGQAVAGRKGGLYRWREFDSDTLARAGIAGWFFGLGYFIFGLFWVGEAFLVEAEMFAWLLPAAVTMLPAGLALFFSAAAIAARALWLPGLRRVVLLAVIFGIEEWLRGHLFTGLPWNTLGYALTSPAVLMQSAGLVGIYGLTVLSVLVFALPLVALSEGSKRQADDRPSDQKVRFAPAYAGILASVGIIAALVGYGLWRLPPGQTPVVDGVRIRIVQPSVPQRDKWRREKQREIFDLHLALSRQATSGDIDDLAGITHVVWPEAAMPFLPLEAPEALQAIGDILPDGVVLLTGALRIERHSNALPDPTAPRHSETVSEATQNQAQRPDFYNSLMAFDSEGRLLTLYDKIHLVPFGEYLPFQSFLESIGLQQLTRVRGGFAAGHAPRPILRVPGMPPLLGLVCYEAIFPAAVVQGSERPGVIVNVTNDGWFGNTTGPRQYFHMAKVRAVEEGVPIIRSANNGISAMIDPYGRTVTRIDLDHRGIADTVLPSAAPPPLYGQAGDSIFMWLCIVLLAGSAMTSLSRR